MNRWGCLGLLIGGLSGLGLVVILLWTIQPAPLSPSRPPAGLPADVSVFLSEHSLSRIASQRAGRPVELDFAPGGQMQISTQVELNRFQPVLQADLLLEMQGTEIVSPLRAVRMNFLTIPADWLPSRVATTTAFIGQAMQQQTPPGFVVVGLETTANGISFDLKWIGP